MSFAQHLFDRQRTYWISPSRINLTWLIWSERNGLSSEPALWERGTALGGDWDRKVIRFDSMDAWTAFQHRFLKGGRWDHTAFYSRILDEIRSKRSKWRCRTVEELDARLTHMDALFDDIRPLAIALKRTSMSRPNDSEIKTRLVSTSPPTEITYSLAGDIACALLRSLAFPRFALRSWCGTLGGYCSGKGFWPMQNGRKPRRCTPQSSTQTLPTFLLFTATTEWRSCELIFIRGLEAFWTLAPMGGTSVMALRILALSVRPLRTRQ